MKFGSLSRRGALRVAVAVGCAAAASAGHAEAEGPRAVIDSLHQLLLEVMRNAKKLGIEGRYAALEPALRRYYDFERMISIATGSYWASADPEARRRLEDAFARFSAMTYASRFAGYTGETFEITGDRPGPRDAVIVDTRLTPGGGAPVAISYVMLARDGQWRIVDVLLDKSISELGVRRSEYSGVLREGGVDRLIATLDEKTQALRQS